MSLIRRLLVALLALMVAATALFAIAVLMPLPAAPLPPAGGSLLIRDARWIDMDSGAIHPGTDILVEAGNITALGPGLEAAADVQLDANGAYVLPGLFDMHVHSMRLAPQLTHPLFVAAGVTAVRDMGGCLGEWDSWAACAADKRHWNNQVAAGHMVGPRFDQVTSLAIDGGKEVPTGWDRQLGAPDPGGAQTRVEHDAARGIDFLKPYSMLPRDSYLELARAAAEQGMYLAGHKPLAVPALEAIAAGQRSIEHAFLFIWECFPGIEALRQAENPRAAYTHETRERMLAEHDEPQCAGLFAAMAAAGTAFVPTHTTRKLDAYAQDPAFRADARLRLVPSPLRYMWLADANSMAGRTTAEGNASYRRFYEFGLRQTGRAHRAGVTVMAGTDAPDSFAFPGSSLHDELGHLVQAGLSPLDALRAATVVPAQFLGLQGKAGEVRTGARADLLLLRDNPLQDIAALGSLDTVVQAGRVYDRARLDALLAGVETSASHWSIWPKFIWQALRSPIVRAQFRD